MKSIWKTLSSGDTKDRELLWFTYCPAFGFPAISLGRKFWKMRLVMWRNTVVDGYPCRIQWIHEDLLGKRTTNSRTFLNR